MVLPETLIDPQDIESEDNMADMSNRTFHCFASLPPELRINIWRHSFPEPRDLLADLMGIRANQWVHLLSTTGVVDEVICKGRYKPVPNPAIAKVCRESRTILFESYTLRLALRKSSIARGRPTCSMCLYLDPTRDTMEFRDASDTFTVRFYTINAGVLLLWLIDRNRWSFHRLSRITNSLKLF